MPLFFDAETDGLFADNPDAPAPNIHCICVYDSSKKTFKRFYNKAGGAMCTTLVEAAANYLCEAHAKGTEVCGFNSAAYDLRLLFAHTKNKRLKVDIASLALEHTDIMLDFWSRTGFPVALQALATGIGAGSKLMHGQDAIEEWKNGNFKKVLAYCDDDCRLLADIVEYARLYGRYVRPHKITKKLLTTVVDDYATRPVIQAVEAAENVDVSWMKDPPQINIDWAVDTIIQSAS